MKKSLLLIVSLLVVVGLLMSCAPKSESPALMKVEGNVKGGSYTLDEAAFEKNSVERTMDDPWMGDGLKYKGIPLSKFLEIVGANADATTITLVATDGKGIDIPVEDAKKWEIMLVHWADGAVLDEKTGGPVKIAFPAEAREKYPDEQWMWWLTTAKVK